MNNDHIFYKLETPCDILDKVFDFIPNSEWRWVPYMNLSINFPAHLLLKDKFLNSIPKTFRPTLRLYKFDSQSIYNWHKDADIGCSFNMVLDDYHCHTIFSPTNRLGIVHDFVELQYEKQKWYLFNSQILHLVMNLHTDSRYLLTVTFPKTVKYEDVFNWVKEIN
jgi:hypothetical protein